MADSLQGTKALVTGGAGFIGSHLVEGLLDAGAGKVVVVDDYSLGKDVNLAAVADRPEVDAVRLDCADLAGLRRLTEAHGPFDHCFNLAVIPLPASFDDPRGTVDHNVAMTTAVCELGREGGYARLVQYSSSEAYGTAQTAPMTEDHPLLPTTPYAASKAATDLVALSYMITFAIPTVVVRPFNTYGPRQNDLQYAGLFPVVINTVRAGEPVTIHGDGLQTRDYVYVADTVRATLTAATSERALGQVLNVGSGIEHTVLRLVATILEALGEPDWPVRHGDDRPGDVRRLLASTARAAELLDYAPSVEIDEGIRWTVDWYLERKPLGDRGRAVQPRG